MTPIRNVSDNERTLRQLLIERTAERDALKPDALRFRFLMTADDYAACMWRKSPQFEDKSWWAVGTDVIDAAMKEGAK